MYSVFFFVLFFCHSQGTSGGVMVSKQDKQTFTSEFDSHWAPHSHGLAPHLSKRKLSKLLKLVSQGNKRRLNIKQNFEPLCVYILYTRSHTLFKFGIIKRLVLKIR